MHSSPSLINTLEHSNDMGFRLQFLEMCLPLPKSQEFLVGPDPTVGVCGVKIHRQAIILL